MMSFPFRKTNSPFFKKTFALSIFISALLRDRFFFAEEDEVSTGEGVLQEELTIKNKAITSR
jgi:hypothetical protein